MKHSEQTKKKMSLNHRTKHGFSSGMKGKKQSNLQKETVRQIAIGNTFAKGNKPNNTSFKKGSTPWNKGGGFYSKETREKMSIAKRGDKSPTWKGGIYPEMMRIRKNSEYRLWRKSCLERDNYTCQRTKISGGKLVVHHINNFAEFQELRYAIDNGITLAESEHRLFHKIYGNENNTKEQLDDFLIDYKYTIN